MVKIIVANESRMARAWLAHGSHMNKTTKKYKSESKLHFHIKRDTSTSISSAKQNQLFNA